MNCFPDDAYAQDPIAPVRVEHRVEFGDRGAADPHFGYWYDFLVYEFAEGDHRAEAVRYLDEDHVTLRVLEPGGLDGPFAARVLVFLALRYAEIQVPGADGDVPLSYDDKARVARLCQTHLDGFIDR